jgi:hypothetical protein
VQVKVFLFRSFLLSSSPVEVVQPKWTVVCEMKIFLFAAFVLLLYVYLWLKRRRNYWISLGFPSAELIFPFGSLKGIGVERSLADGLDDFYKKFKSKGPAVGLFYFTKPLLLPIDPELIRNILATNFECFQNRLLYYNKEDDPISAHLLALEGEVTIGFLNCFVIFFAIA